MLRKLAFSLLCMAMGVAAYGQSSRPPYLPIWASNGIPTTDILQPTNTFIAAGWPLSSTPPSRQYFNWILNRTAWGVDYVLHRGISDWDSLTTYGPNDLVIGSNGRLYRSTQGSNLGNAPPNTSFWNVPAVDTVGNGDNSPSVASTAFVHNNYIPIGGAFSLLGGIIGTNQVPFAAVQQYQGSLSINYSQLVGVPASVNPTANSLVQRDAAGSLVGTYLYQTSGNNENPSISQVMVTNGDNVLRKENFVNFQQQMNLSFIGGQVTAGQVPANAVTQFSQQIFSYNPLMSTSNPGCAQIPGGIIIMWGSMNPAGGTITVGFPCGGFPNAALSVTSNSSAYPTQTNISSWNRLSFVVSNTGGSGNYIAIGY